MTWRLAHSLETLRAQVNNLVPGRGKSSDGSIGDESHSARESDHNPDANGVVKAIDITHDPIHGFNSYQFADMLLRNKDDRVKYVISNFRISSGSGQSEPAWTWRPYKCPPNKNPHDHHVHISVKADQAHYDNSAPWKLELPPATIFHTTEDRDASTLAHMPVLRKGDTGEYVQRMQNLLTKHGIAVSVDGSFGPLTDAAVKQFQTRAGLQADGVVGGYSWRALMAGLA